jgi:hypothetical protein
MHAYIHTCIYTGREEKTSIGWQLTMYMYAFEYIHTHTHTRKLPALPAITCTGCCAWRFTCAYTQIQTYMHAGHTSTQNIYTHTYISMHIHTYIHTYRAEITRIDWLGVTGERTLLKFGIIENAEYEVRPEPKGMEGPMSAVFANTYGAHRG